MSNTLTAIFRPVVVSALWVHHRLLPRDEWVGWTPYLWLLYLAIFFFSWTIAPRSAFDWTLMVLAALVFLILYFRFYWTHRTTERLWIIAAITLLGLVFVAYQGNGQVFIIYASAFCGFTGSMRKSLRLLAIILAVLLLEAALLRLTPWVWAFGLFFGAMIGVANAYFGELGLKNKALKQSQEEIRLLAATAERERISRDLHDLLGHTLTLITVKAELAATLAEKDLQGAAREIREVERISRETLQQVREAVGGYRSGGLIGELANARVALTAADVELTEKIDAPKLSATQDSLLAMLLREAVTNVVRHSGARHCRIRLENRDRHIRLLVEDDGRGGTVHEGNGLKGMRERLQAVAGRLDIASGHDGTRLAILVPVNEHPAPESSSVLIG